MSLLSLSLLIAPYFQVTCNGFTTDCPVSLSLYPVSCHSSPPLLGPLKQSNPTLSTPQIAPLELLFKWCWRLGTLSKVLSYIPALICFVPSCSSVPREIPGICDVFNNDLLHEPRFPSDHTPDLVFKQLLHWALSVFPSAASVTSGTDRQTR